MKLYILKFTKELIFKIYNSENNIKYDFIISPNSNPDLIKIKYKGADSLYIQNGVLFVKTSLVDIIENKPIAYQFINNKNVSVNCNYILNDDIVQFEFPEGYDKNYELVIDPLIVFSTYSNSTSDNKAFTATYDTSGNTYVGGIVFGSGYPTTTGAFDTTWSGSSTSFPLIADISISKFDATGVNLLYSTYLGGNNGEVPQSLVTNDAGELYIYGTTGSNDFPRSIGCYDNSFNGGTNVTPNGCGVNFSNGTDIFITKLNSTGTGIIGSTFIGGTSNDGVNTAFGMAYNHGDEYRGEIILDNLGNCYVTSTTNSSNFPVVGGSSAKGGFSDAISFKLNSNLSSLLWSSYFGGTGNDAGYGIVRDGFGNIFTTGGTMSSTIDSSTNTYGGNIDGFLTKYNSLGVIQSSRYIGTSSYDQSYFVETDIFNNVFVFGQSLGSMAVTMGKYGNAGCHQFIRKYNNSISSLQWGTVVGNSLTSIDISPTAFHIMDCGMIYLSGWGGIKNVRSGGSTVGLPIYLPYQGSTTGSDFYFMVLEPEAKRIFGATFFGGAIGAEHVDGGMSRIDDKGNIYQAICAGCAGTNDYPTTAGVWSPTNGFITNCNVGVVKFKLDEIIADIAPPSGTICIPNSAAFGNNSFRGNTYFWDFGDGGTSTLHSPTHSYTSPGTYKVYLTVSDSLGCLEPHIDSANVVVNVQPNVWASPDTTICPKQSIQLFSGGATTYVWSPATALSSTTVQNPLANPLITTRYRVIGTNVCGSDTAYVNVIVHYISINTSPDTSICFGDSALLRVYGGSSYVWSPAATLQNRFTSSPTAKPSTNTKYVVTATSVHGCIKKDSLYITILYKPSPVLSPDVTKCSGQNSVLTASGASVYRWYPGYRLSSTTSSIVTTRTDTTIKYYVDFINTCGTLIDSVTVTIINIVATSSPDDTICYNEKIKLWATGAQNYSWTPANYCSAPNSSTTWVNPPTPIRFRVITWDNNGCRDTAYTKISFTPIPTVDTGENQVINIGETTELDATHSFGMFYWSYDPTIDCDTCENTTVFPGRSTFYYANIVDSFGCKATDSVKISIDGSIFIPNTFTPNGDYKNEVFKISGDNILEFKILIFTRWGEIIYESDDMDRPWNGKHKGKPVPTGTYIWKIYYLGDDYILKEKTGHVNVLR